MDTNREELIELENKILQIWSSVHESHYWDYYSEFQSLIVSYRTKIEKKEIIDFLLKLRNKVSNEWQDELLSEVLNRLTGYCSSFNQINW